MNRGYTQAFQFFLYVFIFVRAEISCADEATHPGYSLIWSDEFDESELNTNEWFYREDTKHWSSQLASNVSLENGLLRLALRKEEKNGKHYSGAGIISKRIFKYGFYEARLRVPSGKGWHSSFWTMKYNGHDTAPPQSQEIDICEQDSVDHGTYHSGVIAWASNGSGGGRKYFHSLPDLSADFHTLGCEFTPTVVNFFFDGQMTHSIDATQFTQGEQQVWLSSIASWLGNTDSVDDSLLPAFMDIDWVRIYEKTPQ